MLDATEESAVREIFRAARIPWSQLDGRTQRNKDGKVTKLRFSPCLELEECPQRIGDLSSLEEIYIFWASRRLTHLPSDSFDRLRNLRVLQIRWCQGIKEMPSLCDSIEELVIEGCDDIVDFSSFRTAKRTCKRLRSLQIIQVGTRGVASLIEALTADVERDSSKENAANQQNSNKLLDNSSSIIFPCLSFLSLRHNKIDEMDLTKLWPFFRHCHQLTKIDLGNNEIDSLKNLVPVATRRVVSESETMEFDEMALNELNLGGNPICRGPTVVPSPSFNNQQTDPDIEGRDLEDSDGESIIEEDDATQSATAFVQNTYQMKRSDGEDDNLLQIVTANPRLMSILMCKGDCEESNNDNRHDRSAYCDDRCHCFRHSALYSPAVRHALDLNKCSRGKTLMGTRATISYDNGYQLVPKVLSLSKWALVLARTNRVFGFCASTTGSGNLECSDKQSELAMKNTCNQNTLRERVLEERNASVIYSLLQGPALAARGNQFAKD